MLVGALILKVTTALRKAHNSPLISFLLFRRVVRLERGHDFFGEYWLLVHSVLHLVLLDDIIDELFVQHRVIKVILDRLFVLLPRPLRHIECFVAP